MKPTEYVQLLNAAQVVCEKCAGGDCDECPVRKTLLFLKPEEPVSQSYYHGSVYGSDGKKFEKIPFDWINGNRMRKNEAENMLIQFLVDRPFIGLQKDFNTFTMQIDYVDHETTTPYCKVILE